MFNSKFLLYMVKQDDNYLNVASNLVNLLKSDDNLMLTLKNRAKNFKELLTRGHTTYNILNQEFKGDLISEACFCILTANFRADKAVLMQKELTENDCFNFDKVRIEQVLKKYGHRFAKQRADRIVKLREKFELFRAINKQVLEINKEFLPIFREYIANKIDTTAIQNARQNKQSKGNDFSSILEKTYKLRNILVENIDGYGLKEASHFLRNIGLLNVSIIDRHIFRFLTNNNLLNMTNYKQKKKNNNLKNKREPKEQPKITITKTLYKKAEIILLKLAILVNQQLILMSKSRRLKNSNKYNIYDTPLNRGYYSFVITPALLDLILFYNQTGQILK